MAMPAWLLISMLWCGSLLTTIPTSQPLHCDYNTPCIVITVHMGGSCWDPQRVLLNHKLNRPSHLWPEEQPSPYVHFSKEPSNYHPLFTPPLHSYLATPICCACLTDNTWSSESFLMIKSLMSDDTTTIWIHSTITIEHLYCGFHVFLSLGDNPSSALLWMSSIHSDRWHIELQHFVIDWQQKPSKT